MNFIKRLYLETVLYNATNSGSVFLRDNEGYNWKQSLKYDFLSLAFILPMLVGLIRKDKVTKENM